MRCGIILKAMNPTKSKAAHPVRTLMSEKITKEADLLRSPAAPIGNTTPTVINNWEILPKAETPPSALLPSRLPFQAESLRVDISSYILAPAELVWELWLDMDPLPGYTATQRLVHARDGKRDVWTIHLKPRGPVENSANHLQAGSGITSSSPQIYFRKGVVIFRAARPHICRLTVSFEFSRPPTEPLQDLLADHVANLEGTLDNFAAGVTSQLQKFAALEESLFS